MSVYLEWGMMCPFCNRDDHLQIETNSMAHLRPDGTEMFGDTEWHEDSYCSCAFCNCSGKVSAFSPKVDSFETVACLWEAFINGHYEAPEGMSAARLEVIDLHKACDRAHNYARTLGFDAPFDWEFVPFFLDMAIDGVPADWADRVKEYVDV